MFYEPTQPDLIDSIPDDTLEGVVYDGGITRLLPADCENRTFAAGFVGAMRGRHAIFAVEFPMIARHIGEPS